MSTATDDAGTNYKPKHIVEENNNSESKIVACDNMNHISYM